MGNGGGRNQASAPLLLDFKKKIGMKTRKYTKNNTVCILNTLG
jgi:hypothetical protein